MIFFILLQKTNKADILSQAVFLCFAHLIEICNQSENLATELTFYEFNNIKLNHKCFYLTSKQNNKVFSTQ
jgi:hypothetical protein